MREEDIFDVDPDCEDEEGLAGFLPPEEDEIDIEIEQPQ